MATAIAPWPTKTLAELGARVTSGSRGWAAYYAKHGSLFVRITNLTREKIQLDLGSSRYVKIDNRSAEAVRTRLAAGDLLVSITADIGIIGYVDEKVPSPAYINQHIARVRLDPRMADSRFVAYYLSSWGPQRKFVGSTDTGAKAGMNLTTVAGLETVVPALPEQRQIAEALSDVDDLIATLERLIAKKRAIKQGMMQQLLTGRTRLPGFGDAWKSQAVSDLIDGLTAGVSVRSTTAAHHGPAILKTSCVDGGRFIPTEAKPILPSDISRARCHPIAGSLVVSRMNTPSLVGDVGYVRETRRDLFLPDRLWIARPKYGTSVDMRWLNYYFASDSGSARLRELATGTSGSMKNIPKTSLLSLRINAPSEIEQRAIADSLQDVDEEVTLLSTRLVKARAIKTGTMQQLLTGRTRLPLEVSS